MPANVSLPKEGPKRAVLYTRVSTGRQELMKLSIPDQSRQMRQYCASHEIEVVAEFSDAQTGTNGNRSGLEELRKLVQARSNELEFVLVHSFSRLFRDQIELELLQRDLKNSGIELVSITQPIGDDPSGDLLRNIISLMDEHQSKETSKHVARSLAENARQGYWNGGTPPYGYRSVEAGMRGQTIKKKLEISPVEAENVALIFSLYDSGNGKSGPMGVKRITEYLNQNAIKRRKGKNWTVGMVHRVLNDNTYVGEFCFGKTKPKDEQVIIDVPVIVDPTLFAATQQRLRSRNPRKAAPRTVNGPILLTGLAICGKCGGGMTLRTGKSGRYRYYTCGNRKNQGSALCEGQSLPMPELDRLVTEAVAEVLFESSRMEKVLQKLFEFLATLDDDQRLRMEQLKRELTEAESALSRLYDLVMKGLASAGDEDFDIRFSRVKDERDIIRSQLKTLSEVQSQRRTVSAAQVGEFANLVAEKFLTGPIEFRKSYLRAFVESVVVEDDTIRIIPTAA
ncbi:recombinase family protein [Shimia sp.]|uniref:recombinase family protein n=1 Tax=Shimia sp. TaxID=1954381 RepID=UPI00329A2553